MLTDPRGTALATCDADDVASVGSMQVQVASLVEASRRAPMHAGATTFVLPANDEEVRAKTYWLATSPSNDDTRVRSRATAASASDEERRARRLWLAASPSNDEEHVSAWDSVDDDDDWMDASEPWLGANGDTWSATRVEPARGDVSTIPSLHAANVAGDASTSAHADTASGSTDDGPASSDPAAARRPARRRATSSNKRRAIAADATSTSTPTAPTARRAKANDKPRASTRKDVTRRSERGGDIRC